MTLSEIFKRFLQLFILGVLAYFAWIIYRDSREIPIIESSEPQLILSDYQVLRYNNIGELEFSLVGEQLIHYGVDKGSDLTTPLITHYLKNDQGILETDWEAKSQWATISQDQNLVTLKEQVVLYKPNTHTPQDSLTLNTELLYIYDQGERISTDQFVKISTPARILTGTGLEGYPDKEQFTILKDVHTSFMINQDTANE